MAAHTINLSAAAERGIAFEVARRNARNGTNLTVDQVLAQEANRLCNAMDDDRVQTRERYLRKQFDEAAGGTQTSVLSTLNVPTDPATLAQSAVRDGLA